MTDLTRLDTVPTRQPNGRKPEVTDEQILAAGDDLARQGRTLSKWGLRNAIGGGNADRLWAVWLQHRGGAAASAPPAPRNWTVDVQELAEKSQQQMSELLIKAFDAIYQSCEQNAERRHQDAARQARAQLADLEESATALAQDNEALHSERDDLERELANLRDEFSQAAGRQEQTDADLTAARADAGQLQAIVDTLRDELGRARQQLEDLPALQAQLQTAERARQAAEHSQAGMASELASLREQRQDDRQRAAQLQEQLKERDQRLEQAHAARETAARDLALALAELTRAGQAAAEAAARQDKLETELASLRAAALDNHAERGRLLGALEAAQARLQMGQAAQPPAATVNASQTAEAGPQAATAAAKPGRGKAKPSQ
ncbi:hypothetical protein CEK28_08750 [Xenophilus sp. AP218F]|nr:hypothetical protein CEK28_08750 [Xenophilus sp. AP218F]